ncbi:MAG TPA: hypothetical protein VI854_08380 [Acidimicrobiia bacterium]|nr:hypothetical protein [Acidimicrobiia bacterium]
MTRLARIGLWLPIVAAAGIFLALLVLWLAIPYMNFGTPWD